MSSSRPSARTTARSVTPLGAVVEGALAGAAGTLAMDGLLYGRYRRGGGTRDFLGWELSRDVRTWDDAPAPAQVGRRLVEGLFARRLPDRRAAFVNNVTHAGYGALNGAVFGVVAGSLPAARVRHGIPFGVGVWAFGYAVLPAAKLYRPIWTYDRATLAKDLSAHLVYGLTTASAFTLLRGRRRTRAVR
ncbi:hypothetical protein [Mumia sp. DW29H23]|uniref:hypothetical protein n=1 Tax=Mumia sp. DW29H23 TaxID=3421241 RepID=UPI003D69C18A